ncbi:CYTH and CHAD domain-containing protein [Streptomyces xiamenensis]|uniref:CYTH and CHAD domain-containing protein n=1 Tax=Streptomyces xiamenensis TaxID=408015 RepID=UPI0035DC327E
MAVTSATETERKYEATGPLPELTGTGPVAAVRGPDAAPAVLEARYYDTEDRRLTADGITLRRRTGGDDPGWHLKLPVDGDTREEIRAPHSEHPPDGLTDLIRSRTRGAPLVPLVELRTERETRLLLDAAGQPLAEVVRDRVDALRGPRAAHWVEYEVELRPAAGAGLLDLIEERLTAAGLPRSQAPSKAARALAATATPPPAPRPGPALPAGSAGERVMAYVRRQVRLIVELDPAVRRGVPDSVHRMRVATRRLRSALRSQWAVLDRERTGPIAGELRRLGAELGVDRDREVLARRLGRRLSELEPELRRGPLEQRVAAYTDRPRAEASVRALDSARHLDLLTSLDALLTDPPLLPDAYWPAGPVLTVALRHDLRRMERRLRAARRTPPGPDRDAAWHAARKAAKRARYAAETAGKRKRAKKLARVQRVLGQHQDSVQARAALLRIAAAAEAAGEASFSYGVVYEREHGLAEGYEREL